MHVARALALATAVATALATAAACGSTLRPPEPDRRLKLSTSGSLFEGSNGYRFAVLPDKAAKVVRIEVRYPVGSAHDPAGKEGLAHLVEHLLFEVEIERDGRTTSIGAEQGRLALDGNAETAPDHTTYQVTAPPAALEPLLALEVDRLAVGCGGLTEEIFAREREVVLNELRQRLGAGGAALQQGINAALYPEGHPYRATDSVDSVAKLTLADACGFLAEQYQRGRAFVVVAGAVTPEVVQQAVGKHFGRLPARAMTDAPTPPAVAARPGKVTVRGDVERPVLLVTWPLPPTASREHRLLALGWDTIAARLEAFAFTYGWGDSVWTDIRGGHHAPHLVVGVQLRALGDLDEAIDAARKAAEYAARKAVWGEAKDDARWRRRADDGVEVWIARWESLAARAGMFLDFLQLDRDDSMLIGKLDELQHASPDDARGLTERWLDPGKARFVVIEPGGGGGGAHVAAYAGGAPSHPIEVDPALADRDDDLATGDLSIETVRFTLSNGLKVILWPHGQVPLVRARLVVDSGTAHEPGGRDGIAWLQGADQVRPDTMVFSRRDLATRVDALLDGLAAELRFPSYELDDDSKAYLTGQLRSARADERRQFDQQMRTALYGAGHPYARAGLTESTLAKLERDEVMAWGRGHIVPKNATLIVAGQFDPALVRQHIEYLAGHVDGGADSKYDAKEAITTRDFIAGATSSPSPTVELTVAFPAPGGIDGDHGKRLVLQAVLASLLGELRGRDAVTYGFGASFEPRWSGGLWTLGGAADAARAEDAAAALAAILREMRRDPERYRAAFVHARRQVLESLVAGAADSLSISERLTLIARFEARDDFFDAVAHEVATLKLADFHRFVVRELAGHRQVTGAFGPADAVARALDAMRDGDD